MPYDDPSGASSHQTGSRLRGEPQAKWGGVMEIIPEHSICTINCNFYIILLMIHNWIVLEASRTLRNLFIINFLLIVLDSSSIVYIPLPTIALQFFY